MKKEKLKYIAIGVFVVCCGFIYSISAYNKEDEKLELSNTLQETTKIVEEDSETNQELTSIQKICVYVCGMVANPGIYHVDQGTRIYAVIDMAGGFAQDASKDYLNLADLVIDGQKIVIPSIQDVVSGNVSDNSAKETDSSNMLININEAAAEVLSTLPGIGDAKALAIITYREDNGKFQTIEDVMKVEGIKESLYNKIKDFIKV